MDGEVVEIFQTLQIKDAEQFCYLMFLPSSAQAPVQLNWDELAILSFLNSHPPTQPPGIVSKQQDLNLIFSKQSYLKLTRLNL